MNMDSVWVCSHCGWLHLSDLGGKCADCGRYSDLSTVSHIPPVNDPESSGTSAPDTQRSANCGGEKPEKQQESHSDTTKLDDKSSTEWFCQRCGFSNSNGWNHPCARCGARNERPHPTEEDWERLRARVEELYMNRHKTLKQTIEVLRTENDLSITERMLRHRMKRWNYFRHRRNYNESGWSDTSEVSVENPKLLTIVEDAIHRLILPEIEAIKRNKPGRSTQAVDPYATEDNKEEVHYKESEAIRASCSESDEEELTFGNLEYNDDYSNQLSDADPCSEERPFKCLVIGCDKAYKNTNSLRYHERHGHSGQQLTKNANGTLSIINPETGETFPGTLGIEKERPYCCERCGKRYKNLNGLMYHKNHGPHCDPGSRTSKLMSISNEDEDVELRPQRDRKQPGQQHELAPETFNVQSSPPPEQRSLEPALVQLECKARLMEGVSEQENTEERACEDSSNMESITPKIPFHQGFGMEHFVTSESPRLETSIHQSEIAQRIGSAVENETDELSEDESDRFSICSAGASSIFSEISAASTQTSTVQSGLLDECLDAFASHPRVQCLGKDAAAKINKDRFERNIGRLLKAFSRHLRDEADGHIQVQASRCLGATTRYVADKLTNRFYPVRQAGDAAQLSGSEFSRAVEVFDAPLDEPDEAMEADANAAADVQFAEIKGFVMSGEPFENFITDLDAFVNPSSIETPLKAIKGGLANPLDALLLLEVNNLTRIRKRPTYSERQVIGAGSVFVWNEEESGFSKWYDGRTWKLLRRGLTSSTSIEVLGDRNHLSEGEKSNDKPLLKIAFTFITNLGNKWNLISYHAQDPRQGYDPLLPTFSLPANGPPPSFSLYKTLPFQSTLRATSILRYVYKTISAYSVDHVESNVNQILQDENTKFEMSPHQRSKIESVKAEKPEFSPVLTFAFHRALTSAYWALDFDDHQESQKASQHYSWTCDDLNFVSRRLSDNSPLHEDVSGIHQTFTDRIGELEKDRTNSTELAQPKKVTNWEQRDKPLNLRAAPQTSSISYPKGFPNSTYVHSQKSQTKFHQGQVVKTRDVRTHDPVSGEAIGNMTLHANLSIRQRLSGKCTKDSSFDTKVSTARRGGRLVSVKNVVDKMFRKRPELGKRRIEWTCSCGKRIYDDYLELKPGALDKLQERLEQRNTKVRSSIASDSTGTNTSSQGISGIFRTLLSLISGSASSCDPEKLPSHEQQISQDLGDRPPNSSDQSPIEHLLLLFPFRSRASKVDQPTSCDIRTDHDFFTWLYHRYESFRWSFKHLLSFRTLLEVRFVEFQLRRNELANVLKLDALPPLEEKDHYKYTPMPPEYLPPIGSNEMIHYLEYPGDLPPGGDLFSCVPKKMRERLGVCPDKGYGIGWGIQFVEGVCYKKASLMMFLSAMLSIVLAVTWAVWKQDVQTAFTVGTYVFTVLASGLGSLQAVFEK